MNSLQHSCLLDNYIDSESSSVPARNQTFLKWVGGRGGGWVTKTWFYTGNFVGRGCIGSVLN